MGSPHVRPRGEGPKPKGPGRTPYFGASKFSGARIRMGCSTRPGSGTSGAIQAILSLASYAALLAAFSPIAVVVLVLAGIPSFLAEAKFAGDAFRLFKWRTPETREQLYLETVLAREDHVKEVKL